jgi:hypothetical protein
MSEAATELTIARLLREEGMKLQPYDDATGQTVRAPVGNLSWGIGFNLEECGSLGLFNVMLRYLLRPIETMLQAQPWYASQPDVVQSVCQDIAYNGGIHGFLGGYPKMIGCLEQHDLTGAALECKVSDPHLDASRYAPLRKIIESAIG